MNDAVTRMREISFRTLIDDALTFAGVSTSARTVTADMARYFSSDPDPSIRIAPPRRQLSAAQMMIILEKLLGVSCDNLMETVRAQVDALEETSHSQLQEHLKKFNDMLAQQAKERASRSRGGILGWIQKVATLVVSVVVLAAIAAPILAGTAGVGAAPVIMALIALWSAGGALADIAVTAESGKGLGEAMGSDIGGAVASCSLGESLAIGVREGGGNQGWQIFAAVTANVLMAVAMGKYGSMAQLQGRMTKILARTTDLTMRLNMTTSGVTHLGQGLESLTQAGIQKWISHLRADLVTDQTQVTANQEHIEKSLEVVRAAQEILTKFFKDASESASREFQGLSALVQTPSRRPAVA